jgi:hypothetical protein
VAMAVPQSSVLGLTLFSTYSGPIYHISVRHGINSQLYSDDTDLYAKFKLNLKHFHQSEMYCRLADCVDEKTPWMKRNKLKFNGDISELLLVYSARKRCRHTKMVNCSLTPHASIKNLGVIIDVHLSD